MPDCYSGDAGSNPTLAAPTGEARKSMDLVTQYQPVSLGTAVPTVQPKPTRGAIVSVLSLDWPLTLTQVYSKLKSRHGVEVSYQAIHKSLRQMAAEGILSCTDRKYALSPRWLKNLRNLVSSLEKSLNENPFQENAEMPRQDYAKYGFETILDFYRFLLFNYFEYPNEAGKPSVFHWKHVYSLIGLSREELHRLARLVSRTECYILVNSGGMMDQCHGNALAKMAEHLGASVKLRYNALVALDSDVLVVGDYVARAYFPTQAREEMLYKLNSASNLKEFDLGWLLEFLHEKPVSIKVQVVRDAELADQIREETMAYFE